MGGVVSDIIWPDDLRYHPPRAPDVDLDKLCDGECSGACCDLGGDE